MNKQVAVYDNTVSARIYLSYIAEQAGGFACIGRDGKLYIRKIGQSVAELPLRYFQTFKWGDKFKFSRVRYEDGIQLFEKGDETDNTVYINQDNMYIVDQEQIDNIYNQLNGLEVYGFEGESIIDPALDVGDLLLIDGKYVIYQGSIEYARRFKASISSKIQCKEKEETTTRTLSQKTINRRVQSEINQIDGKITQLTEENTETSKKLTQHEQDINGVKTTVSSLEETSITDRETVNKIQNQIKDKEDNFNFKYHLDVVVHGETNKFYPVIIKYGNQDIKRSILVKRGYSEQAPADWYTSTHKGALTLKILCNFGGWGGTTYSWEISEFQEQYAELFGGAINCGNNTMFAIFLRGGGETGAKYHLYSDMPLNSTGNYSYSIDNDGNYIVNGLPSPQIAYNSDLCFCTSNGNYKAYAPAPREMVASENKYVRTSSQNEEIRVRNYVKLSQSNDTALKKTVKQVDVEYYLSTSETIASGGTWSTTAPTWQTGKYMWSRQKITYVDGTTATRNPTCIAGAKGDKGNDGVAGKDGNGINSITYYYAVTSNQTAPSASSITSTTIPTLTSTNKYLWQKEVIDFTDSSVADKTTVVLLAVYGDKGNTGATGKGINSIQEQYYLSTSNTAQEGGSWKNTQDEWTEGHYIWTRSKITWTDGTTTYTTPVLAEALNSANSTANNAVKETTKKIAEQQIENDNIRNIVSETVTKLNNDYLTAEQVEAEIDTTKKDIEILKEKQASTELTSEDFRIQIDSIINNGVSKVKTSMGYTFDDEGMKINKEDADTGTIIDEAGVRIVDKTGANEENLLYAGYVKEGDSNYPNYVGQTIVASANMIVQNYLVVPNSRFEAYENPELGGHGTGVFEI